MDWLAVDRLPLVMCYPPDDDSPFRPFRHSEIFSDPEKMLYNELVHAFDTSIAMRSRIDDDLPLTVRACSQGRFVRRSTVHNEAVQGDGKDAKMNSKPRVAQWQ